MKEKCSNCGEELEGGARACPRCGQMEPLPPFVRLVRNIVGILPGAVAVYGSCGLVLVGGGALIAGLWIAGAVALGIGLAASLVMLIPAAEEIGLFRWRKP